MIETQLHKSLNFVSTTSIKLKERRSDISGEYERGYQDGLEAGRNASEHDRADSALGELIGSMLAGKEEVIAEQCNTFESEEYQEGFRQGVRDFWEE